MRVVLVLMIAIWTGGLTAADTLEITLDQAVAMALKNNDACRISELEIKQFQFRLWQNIGILPQISIAGNKNLSEKLMTVEIPPFFPGDKPQEMTLDFTRNYEFSLQVVQPVFTGGKLYFNYKNAQIDVKLSRERQRQTQAETVLNVKKAFYNVQVYQELLRAMTEARAIAEKNLETVQQRQELGMASRYDLLQAELALRNALPEISRIETVISSTLQGLKIMIGVPVDQEMMLKGELRTVDFRRELNPLLDLGLANRFELRQMKMEQQKADNLLKLTWAQFIPDFSVVASYSFRSDLFRFTRNNWENYYTVNLAIQFPIFSGLKRGARVGELNVAKKILALNYQQLAKATRLEIENKYRMIRQELENVEAGLKNMELAEEGLRVGEMNYKEGLIGMLEFNSSTNEWTRARVNYLQALYNYNIAVAEMDKLVGTISRGKEGDVK